MKKMKNTIMKFLGLAALAFASAGLYAADLEAGADGKYHVASLADFKAFRDMVAVDGFVGKTAVLDADLDLGNEEWTPIGPGSRSGRNGDGTGFVGVFDGQNHSISGLKLSGECSGKVAHGLFGLIKGGEIRNFSVSGSVNMPKCSCAGLAAGVISDGGVIRGVTTYGTVHGESGVGGVVGRILAKGRVLSSTNNVAITSVGYNVGGIVGAAYYTADGQNIEDCVVSNCVNKANVIAGSQSAGGIVGLSIASIRNCVNYGKVFGGGGNSFGGIVGNQKGYGEVVGCVNYGEVGKTFGHCCVGGIIGYYQPGSEKPDTDYPARCLVTIKDNVNWGDVNGVQQQDRNDSISGILGMADQGSIGYAMLSNVNHGLIRRYIGDGWVEGYAFLGAQNTEYVGSWTISGNKTSTTADKRMFSSATSEAVSNDNSIVTLAAVDANGVEYGTLAEALESVSVANPLKFVNGTVWSPTNQTFYAGKFYGTMSDAILAANAANSSDAALIYVRPNQKGLSVNAHDLLKTSITIHGNNASVGSQWAPSIEGPGEESVADGRHTLTKSVSHAIYNLHDGAGFWGTRCSDFNVTLTMENCENANECYSRYNSKSGQTVMTVRNCTFLDKEAAGNVVEGGQGAGWPVAVYGNGSITVEDCLFNGCVAAVVGCLDAANANLTISVTNTVFKNLKGQDGTKGGIRIAAEKEGTISLTMGSCSFVDGNAVPADVTIGDKEVLAKSKATVSYSIVDTACSLMVTEKNSSELKVDEAVEASATPVTGDNLQRVVSVGEDEYLSIDDALAAIQPGQTMKLLVDQSYTMKSAEQTFTFDPNGHRLTLASVNGYVGVCDFAVGGLVTAKSVQSLQKQADGKFHIASLDELKAFRAMVNILGVTFKNEMVVLDADIDLADEEWEPIGYSAYVRKADGSAGYVGGKSFLGAFDGQSHVVSNLKMTVADADSPAYDGAGLFGYAGAADENTSFCNLTIHNAHVAGRLYVGAMVGLFYAGAGMSNCHVTGEIQVEGSWYVGGLVGNGYSSPVYGCSVAGDEGKTNYVRGRMPDVYGYETGYVGGLWGFRGEGANVIDSCRVENLVVEGQWNGTGGIVGIGHYGNSVKNCSVVNSVVNCRESDGNCGLIAGSDLGVVGSEVVLENCEVVNSTACEGYGTAEEREVFVLIGTKNNNGNPPASPALVRRGVAYDENGKYLSGVFSYKPAKEDVADDKVIVDNGDGTWTVQVSEIHVNTDSDPTLRDVEVETTKSLTEDEQKKVAENIGSIKTNLVESVANDSVVASSNTGISGALTEETKGELIASLEADAEAKNLTADAVAQIADSVDALLNGEETTSASNFLDIAVSKFDAKVTSENDAVTAKVTTVVYEVTPIIETVVSNVTAQGTTYEVVQSVIPNSTVKEMADNGSPMSFNLPVDDPKATSAKVLHHSSEPDVYPDEEFVLPVWTDESTGKRYVTVTVSHFSFFEITPSSSVLMTEEETIGIYRLPDEASGEVSFGVPFTMSGTNAAVALPIGGLVVTGRRSADGARVWTAGKDDTNEYASVASADALAPGKAVWYSRAADPDVPLAVAGYVVTNGITTAGAATATARPGLTLFANPYRAEIPDVAAKLSATPAEGDQIVVEGDSTRYVYSNGAWCRLSLGSVAHSNDTVKIRTESTLVPVSAIPLPAGKTFWYAGKTTVQSVKW